MKRSAVYWRQYRRVKSTVARYLTTIDSTDSQSPQPSPEDNTYLSYGPTSSDKNNLDSFVSDSCQDDYDQDVAETNPDPHTTDNFWDAPIQSSSLTVGVSCDHSAESDTDCDENENISDQSDSDSDSLLIDHDSSDISYDIGVWSSNTK
ncbi:hypothetical protein ACF0H5_016790 [Mactra antiquata]